MMKFVIGFVLGGMIITFYPDFLPAVGEILGLAKESVCQML